jgi:hypothetical protein
MHIEGRYDAWNTGHDGSPSASELAWKVFCQFQFRNPDETRRQVWALASEKILHAILTFLSQRPLQLSGRERAMARPGSDIGQWFFYNSLYQTHPHLETTIRLRQPIIGIGAPAGIFLPAVAQALHTELVLPDHHQVANAVGAIAGSVMVEEEILIYPKLSASGLEVFGYFVQTSDERREFEELTNALNYARTLGQERALGAAIRSGADNPEVTVEELSDGLDTYRIRAKAVGNPRLAR